MTGSMPVIPEGSMREFYGSEMRRLREELGWSLEKMSDKVNFSKSHLSRIELAEYMIPPDLSAKLDEVFGTGKLFQTLYRMVCEEAHPDKARRRMELEARAQVIEEYSGLLVPGLIQTEDYARTIFIDGNPMATPDKIEEMVRSRMSRQERLRADNPPFLSAILDEAVIRRPIGGTGVWRAQLSRLEELTHTPTTVIQVLPFAHGAYPLMAGPLSLLTLDDRTQVSYTEGLDTQGLKEEWDNVRRRRQQYDLLRAYALSPSATAALIRDAMEALPE